MAIYIDGASRGNPGYSGIGIVINRGEKTIKEYKEFIGKKTNNQAEYAALKKALELASLLDEEITIFSDSELVVNQRKKHSKVRSKELKMFFSEITNLERFFRTVIYKHIPRKANSYADSLANLAIEERIKYRNRII